MGSDIPDSGCQSPFDEHQMLLCDICNQDGIWTAFSHSLPLFNMDSGNAPHVFLAISFPSQLLSTFAFLPPCSILTLIKMSCSASPRAPASIAAVGLEGILSEASSPSSQQRRTLKKPNTKNIEKSCFYRQNEIVPPRFKQYKIQGNASNIVQSHFGSPAAKVLESGIAPLVALGFYPAYWGLNQPSPSPQE